MAAKFKNGDRVRDEEGTLYIFVRYVGSTQAVVKVPGTRDESTISLPLEPT